MKKEDLTKYCYNNETRNEWLNFRSNSPHFKSDEIEVIKIQNGFCIPDCGKVGRGFSGGVFDDKKEPVKCSFQRKGLETSEQLLESIQNTEIKYINQKIVYLGQYRNQWGSFLVDSISRLWYALRYPEKYKYVFLATQTSLGGIHKNVYEFLSLLGIEKQQILYITKPTQFREIIIPDMSYIPAGTHHRECCWHKEYLDIINKVVSNVSINNLSECHDKVYFSRGKFSKDQKSDYGEELIIDLMRKNGFYIVYPEEHTLQEQIKLVNQCSVFASVGGSCAHNIIFSQTRPKMILFNRMNGYQWHQWMLDEIAGVEPVLYVDAYIEPYRFFYKTDIRGPYLFWINTNVKKFLIDNNFYLEENKKNNMQKAIIFMRYTFRIIHSQLYKIKKRILK